MTITEDLIAAGVQLRQRQEKAKAELEAEREERERLREERARAFWNQVGIDIEDERAWRNRQAAILPWPRRESK